MKGIVLAGGKGSRLWPLTKTVNKQILPVYDKPMIYYPLVTLMLAGVTEILLVTSETHLDQFKELLSDGSQWGIRILYAIQTEPNGVADAFNYAPESFRSDSVMLVLGDNLLYGMGLGSSLRNAFSGKGAKCFAYSVSNPQDYGVIKLDEFKNPITIVEKPESYVSNYAIPGVYFFDSQVYNYKKDLKPSLRGEYEITDLLRKYQNIKLLKVDVLERGTAWLDTGNASHLIAAGEFVRVIEERQGLKIGCPEEVAFREGLITSYELKNLCQKMPIGSYRDYLEDLCE